jgi:hypothetical protein
MEEFKSLVSGNTIKAEKITKPIQLLAAWLIGLVLTNTIFLGAAVYISSAIWTHYLLVIASVANVPLFLFSIFILQTKYRPELQEDSFYADYIINNRGDKVLSKKKVTIKATSEEISLSENSNFNFVKYSVAINDYLFNLKNIEKSLADAGIPISSYFGKANKVAEMPKKWTISIDKEVDKESLNIFLTTMLQYSDQFDGFYFDEKRNSDDNSIYIGGYVIDNALFPLNEVFIKKIYQLKNEESKGRNDISIK